MRVRPAARVVVALLTPLVIFVGLGAVICLLLAVGASFLIVAFIHTCDAMGPEVGKTLGRDEWRGRS